MQFRAPRAAPPPTIVVEGVDLESLLLRERARLVERLDIVDEMIRDAMIKRQRQKEGTTA